MMLHTSGRGLHRGIYLILLWEETHTISASQEETPLGNTLGFLLEQKAKNGEESSSL